MPESKCITSFAAARLAAVALSRLEDPPLGRARRRRPGRAFVPDGGPWLDARVLLDGAGFSSYISVEDQSGNVVQLQGGQQLITQLTQIQLTGGTVHAITIKGHGDGGGDDGVIQLADTVTPGDPTNTMSYIAGATDGQPGSSSWPGSLFIDGQNVTRLLQTVTTADTTITYTGCSTSLLAQGTSAILPGVAYGGPWPMINIPYTPYAFGVGLVPYRAGQIVDPPADDPPGTVPPGYGPGT
jgi:hypothetical protein